METEPEWKRVHREHYVKGPTWEDRIGIFLLLVIPVVWLFFVGLEVYRYHRGL
jgi:hypothetical protein